MCSGVRSRFTLLEVMIAAAVLAMAAVLATSVLGGARARILRAEKRWGREHILAQAAELYLLGGPRADVPEGLLPEGFSCQCSLTAVEEGLDEAGIEPQEGWVLGEFHIRVFDTSGNAMAECTVQKVVREDDCE
ncbi:MAG: hypothetical protein JXR77_11665 [Lentisphaeria bacterium]|nr:hypothetical protein [Lentisphaeria bacterium]